MNFIDDLNINSLFERYTESYTKVKSNLYGLYAIQPRIKGKSYCYEKLRLWRRWLLKKSRTNTVPFGAPFTAGFTTKYRYDNQVNPYYHAGIPFFCNAFQGRPAALAKQPGGRFAQRCFSGITLHVFLCLL